LLSLTVRAAESECLLRANQLEDVTELYRRARSLKVSA
jgi:hypothetical protein